MFKSTQFGLVEVNENITKIGTGLYNERDDAIPLSSVITDFNVRHIIFDIHSV